MPNLAHKISQNNIALVCIIVLLGILAHAGTLSSPFKTLDDNFSIVNNPDIKDPSGMGKIFTKSFFGGGHYYRPMVSLSFWVEYQCFGLRPFFYNLTNVGLHLAVAVIVFFLMLLLLEDRVVSFFVSLLFAVHPIHWEAVSNIPGRAVILSAFFTINAFFFFCLSRQRKQFAVFYVLSLVLFACGLLSKESAAMLPAVLLGYLFFAAKGAKRYSLTLPFFALVIAYIFLRRTLGFVEIYPWRTPQEHVLGFFTFLTACLTYLGLFIWPVGLHFDRAQPMFLKFSDPGLFSTLIAVAALAVGLIRSSKRLPGSAKFFMAWFCLELFPVSQIITTIGVGPGYISSAEHFLYMPSVGIFALMALGIKALYQFNERAKVITASVLRIMVAAFFCVLVLVTIYLEIFSSSALSMFKRTLEYNPHNARILFSTGLELANRQRFAEAELYFRRALEREPLNASYRIALGRALYDRGKWNEALVFYETVADPGSWKDLLNRNRQIAYETAMDYYQDMIRRDPGNAQAYYGLGTIFSRAGRIEESIDQYNRALAIEPNDRNALFNLASSYATVGRQEDAIACFERVIAMEGGEKALDYYARLHVGKIYQQRGDEAKAREYFLQAEAIKNMK